MLLQSQGHVCGPRHQRSHSECLGKLFSKRNLRHCCQVVAPLFVCNILDFQYHIQWGQSFLSGVLDELGYRLDDSVQHAKLRQ